MPEAVEKDGGERLERLIAGWQSSLERVQNETADARPLLEEVLGHADSDVAHEEVRGRLGLVQLRGDIAQAAIAGLMDGVTWLQEEWKAATRYTPDALARRTQEIGRKVERDPVAGAQAWLLELFDAIDARQVEAVRSVAGVDLPWDDDLRDGAQQIRDGVATWLAGDHATGLELVAMLASVELAGWDPVLTLELRSRAHRLAAWVALRRLKDAPRAERHLQSAVELFPLGGRMHAERAAYFLFVGALDHGVTEAQHAIEFAGEEGVVGFLELGIAFELSGEFADADDLYRRALKMLPRAEVAHLQERASFIDPPGRLLIIAAEELLASNRPKEALEVAERALATDLRGTEEHPQAQIHKIRRQALERLGSDAEAAVAALEAGRLFMWNGEVHTAIAEFERALALDDSIADVGWYLADSVVATSLPFGATVPDASAVTAALEIWDRWAAKVGLPAGDSSWAYVTRAVMADLATQQHGADRVAGVWESLLYIEKALVHDDVDAQRWGYAAQYLRYLDLEELAFETAERGYGLAAGDRQVLAERLPRLANRGSFSKAEAAARELVAMFGDDPWVNAVRAWLAMHSDRSGRYEDALALLELSLAEGNDPSWYYDLRALCHLAQGAPAAALEEYGRLIERAPPIDGTTKCRLAMASVLIGERVQAKRWLAAANDDPTTRPITCLTADALLAVGDGDLDRGEGLLARATGLAMSEVQVDDTLDEFGLRLLAMRLDDERLTDARSVVERVGSGPGSERKKVLRADPPTPHSELKSALRSYGSQPGRPDSAETVLLAVRARRQLHRREFAKAADSYDRLLRSSFEPEATIALRRALTRLSREREIQGEFDEVRGIQDRLAALGGGGPADAAIAVSSALEFAGRYREARELLEGRLDSARDGRELEELHQRAGGLALSEDRLESAEEHFAAALASAREREDHGPIGQLEIRLALVSAIAGDLLSVRQRLHAAAIAWRAAGAIETGPALQEELRGLLVGPRAGSWAAAVEEVMKIVKETRADTVADLEPW